MLILYEVIKKKILCGMNFFEQLQADRYNVIFKEQLKTDNIITMIKYTNNSFDLHRNK